MALTGGLAIFAVAIILALCIYPWELSFFPARGNRWLYDRGAQTYERKWQRHDYTAYETVIAQAALAATQSGKPIRVADLACGTGRASRVVAQYVSPGSRLTGVDYSMGMLERFAAHIGNDARLRALDPELNNVDLASWLARQPAQQFDVLLLMEAAEFIPSFGRLLPLLGGVCAQGGYLVMTRPAGLWSRFFPGRSQSRAALRAGLIRAGFDDIRFRPWRSRYELVSARRTGMTGAATPTSQG